ncbi:serine hydrolase [Gordonibacter sp. An230]|uniref:serine hydrolase n=1 Tax=Gordonibacter sp. An230 TaxID=1965592 RepID=UPI001EF696D3|nr:serine hydrolase [Gordonibacter sp. An230]
MTVNWDAIGRKARKAPLPAKVALAACVGVFALSSAIGVASALSPVPETPIPPSSSAFSAADAAVEVEFEGAAAVPSDGQAEPSSLPGASASDPFAVAAEARAALDCAASSDGLSLFDGSDGASRVLDSGEAPDVEAAIAAFADADCSVGFVVYDLAAQRGLSYNADGMYFCASTVKAPFVSYVLQDAVAGGTASLDDEVEEDLVVEGTGIMSEDDVGSYDLRTVVENTLIHSDNTGYALLRERFGADGFEAWCERADVDTATWSGEWYPSCAPRDLAKLWVNIGAFLMGDDPNAQWCQSLLERTRVSFLREALGPDRTVLSKPGYEVDIPGYSTAALDDAGLVVDGDGAYVVAIMSDAGYDDEHFTDNEHLIVDLAAALDAAHDRLLVESEVS